MTRSDGRRPSGARTATGPRWIAGLLVLLAASGAAGFLRIHSSSGAPLGWKGKSVSFVLHVAGSDDVADGSDIPALRQAFAAWDAVDALPLSLVEDTTPEQRARTDWPSDDVHLVLFAEDGDELLFPEASGIVAVTPLKYVVSTGRILDADIVFNGRDHGFATTLGDALFDVRSVATHEVGHLLGLNHGAQGCATMTPFAHPGFFLPRTLSADDRAGAASFGSGGPGARIQGSVARAGSGVPVSGAHVWARSAHDGRVVGATFSDGDGAFVLRGLPAGEYAVTAAPLDGPLTPSALTNGVGLPSFATDFQPSAPFVVSVGANTTLNIGSLSVPEDGSLRITAPYTARVLHPGASLGVALSVKSLVMPGTVSLPGAEDAFSITDLSYAPMTGLLTFVLHAAADAPVGAYDILVQSDSGVRAVAAGMVEVVVPRPVVDTLFASCGSAFGGALLVLTGTHLDQVQEARLGGVAVPALASGDGTSLDLVTPATASGALDLVLVTPSGEDVLLPGAYGAWPAADPQLASVFPSAGSSAGGTSLTLLGAGFDADTAVSVGGVPAVILVLDAGRIVAAAPSLAPGAHTVRVENVHCGALSAEMPGAFLSVDGADPTLLDVTPSEVPHAGGTLLELHGAGFVPGTRVVLGRDALDGAGGVELAAEFVDATMLRAVAPSLALGAASVSVRLPDERVAFWDEDLAVVALLDGKDRLLGEIDAPGAHDPVWIDLVQGTTLHASLRRVAPGDLLPALTLLAPDGTPLVSSDPDHVAFDPGRTSSTPKRARLLGIVAAQSGRHVLVLSGREASTGAYRLDLGETLPKEAKGLKLPPGGGLAPGAGPVTFELSAKAGSRLSGRLRGKGGLRIVLLSLAGPDGPLLAGDVDGTLLGPAHLVDAVERNADGTLLRIEDLPLAAFGTYSLEVGAVPGTSGALSGRLRVRPPQGKTVLVE